MGSSKEQTRKDTQIEMEKKYDLSVKLMNEWRSRFLDQVTSLKEEILSRTEAEKQLSEVQIKSRNLETKVKEAEDQVNELKGRVANLIASTNDQARELNQANELLKASENLMAKAFYKRFLLLFCRGIFRLIVDPHKLNNEHWEKDSDRNNCQSCDAEFNIFKRKHHCRKYLNFNADVEEFSAPKICHLQL